jgi:pimeloyl-ACP methyl ester carboxylesterase
MARLSRTESASNGRHLSAVAVMLATLGCAPAGSQTDASLLVGFERTLEVPGSTFGRIGYLQAGDPGATRLILVHGTPGSASGWAAYLHDPPPGFDVIAIDRPGFGRSGPDGPVVPLAEQARAVAALLPTDGRRAVLLGHSLGGPIVAWVAAEHPERVASVILLAASLDPAQEKIHPMQYVGNWPFVRPMLPRALRNANAELMGLEPELRTLETMLPTVSAPTYIVHGTKDDLVPVANVPFMQARLTGAACVQTRLLDGLNHFLPWNSAPIVRETIALAAAPRCPSTGPR